MTVSARGNAFHFDTTPPVNVFRPEDREQFALDDTRTHQDASLAEMSAKRLSLPALRSTATSSSTRQYSISS